MTGAGTHADSSCQNHKSICKRACQQAMALLLGKGSALEAVTAAVAAMENDECTNTGRGSNLTMHGTVECDASVMCGSSLSFGAVGALSGVANPVTVARRLVEEKKLGPLPFGRIRPSILVGKGAQEYCVEHGIGVNDNLITDSAYKTFLRYSKKCFKKPSALLVNKKRKFSEIEKKDSEENQKCENPRDDQVQDTVGAVCIDSEGNMAAAASSGGIWLKHAGRLGPAAVYGAGCWAQNETSESKPGIAAVTSGCGEQLMQTLLAKTCCDSIRSTDNLTQALTGTFKSNFMESEFLAGDKDKFAGALLLRKIQINGVREIEVLWIHSTASMCFGYMSGKDKTPTVRMSRLDERCCPGQSFVIEGHTVLTSGQPAATET
ncbi:threonine aspartase 1-like isoform X2 [Physella acuta]|uniref:threonine aspartase 1-like isoform X2 n=1 Tax=Physella acuta TaxID=109671 RepID=UPI0027DCB4FD|nr:threonine aspartase 1-like isoform X2 [Physella acuta]